jgi:hypothetical protein
VLPSPAIIKLAAVAFALLASFFFGVRYQNGVVARERLAEQNLKVEKTNAVLAKQGDIAKQTQEQKDELQKRYDSVVSAWRDSLRQSANGGANINPASTIQGRSFRLSGENGEVLIKFARDCERTEIERNDLIGRYDSLK